MRQLELWKDGSRFRNVVAYVESRGADGCIRDDLDRDRVCPIQSVCGIVLELLRARVFVYTGERRLTRLEKPARVFVANKFTKRMRGQK